MSSPLWEGVREGCGTCEFVLHQTMPQRVDTHGNVINPEWWNCRRYPPVLIPMPRGDGYGNTNVEVEQHQPGVAQDDWCGEYKRKLP